MTKRRRVSRLNCLDQGQRTYALSTRCICTLCEEQYRQSSTSIEACCAKLSKKFWGSHDAPICPHRQHFTGPRRHRRLPIAPVQRHQRGEGPACGAASCSIPCTDLRSRTLAFPSEGVPRRRKACATPRHVRFNGVVDDARIARRHRGEFFVKRNVYRVQLYDPTGRAPFVEGGGARRDARRERRDADRCLQANFEWQNEFTLDLSMFPSSYIKLEIAEKVLFVGKAMRVLQHPSASSPRRPRRARNDGWGFCRQVEGPQAAKALSLDTS